MNFDSILQYVLTAVGGSAAALLASYGMFKWLGAKWLESKFAERLQNLKSEQDQAIRYVQSSIDREIHRAKKLYDNEFTALSECWRLLVAAFESSRSTIGSMTTPVDRLGDEDLESYLLGRGMDERERQATRTIKGSQRQDRYHRWSEYERYKQIHELWRNFRKQLDANGIFFRPELARIFHELGELILSSNTEFRQRVEYIGQSEVLVGFTVTVRLQTEGEPLVKKLEAMVRDRLWSAVSDAATG